ncbi:MAG: hypothetical protein KDD45_01970, partial [Bdellovibrionales bacterium]|nr:hypothetical protein [Bdellovibrionales bacterium]
IYKNQTKDSTPSAFTNKAVFFILTIAWSRFTSASSHDLSSSHGQRFSCTILYTFDKIMIYEVISDEI